MNLNEIKQPSDQKLFEELDPQNDTGFLTEDLIKITRAHNAGEWTEHLTEEDFVTYLRGISGGAA